MVAGDWHGGAHRSIERAKHLDHEFPASDHYEVAFVEAVLAPLGVLRQRVRGRKQYASVGQEPTSLNSFLLPTMMPLLSNAPPSLARLFPEALSGRLGTTNDEC